MSITISGDIMSKKIETVTPIGEIKWFNLVDTDKFGNFSVELKLEDSPETHKLISQIDSLSESGRKPYKKQADGSFDLKIKMKSQGMKRDNTPYTVNPPAIYNSTGKRFSEDEARRLSVGNGTECRFKVVLSSYDVNGSQGVSCKPKSVQIAKLVEFGGDAGFDALEFEELDSGEEVKAASGIGYDF